MRKNLTFSVVFQVMVAAAASIALFTAGYFAQSANQAYWMVGSVAVILQLLYVALASRIDQAYRFTFLLFLLAGVFSFSHGSAAFREVIELGFEPQDVSIEDIDQYTDKTPRYVKITGILRNDLALHWSVKSFTPDASGASTYHESYEHKCLTPFTGRGWNNELTAPIMTDLCQPSWKNQSPKLKTIQGYLVAVDKTLPAAVHPYIYPQSPVNPLPTVETEPMRFKIGDKTLLLMSKRRPENLVILGVLLIGGWFVALLSTLLFKAHSTHRSAKP